MQSPDSMIQFFCMSCEAEAYAIGFNTDADGNLWFASFCGNDECEQSKQMGWLVMTASQLIQMVREQNPKPRGMDNGYL